MTSFGTGAAGAPAMLRPTSETVQSVLDALMLLHAVDADGDVCVPFEDFAVVFMHLGAQGEILQARGLLHRRFPVESRTALTAMIDDWNRTRIGPKAYTVLPDDGLVGVCCEHTYDFEVGATRAQIHYVVTTWLATISQFAEWLADVGALL